MFNGAKIITVVVLAGLVSLCNPAQALAREDRDRSHHDKAHFRSYPYGQISLGVPMGSISIGFGGGKYYYGSGLFYRTYQHQYVVVPPPAGVVVYSIPAQYNQVVIDGMIYYTYNGVYYTRVPQGYQVVQPPPVVVEAASVTTTSLPDEEQIFTVNIPLTQGGYKAVAIRRDGEGFQGPQGEYYPEFPKVQQLKVMYGDKVK